MEGFFSVEEIKQRDTVPALPLCTRCGLHKGCQNPLISPGGKGKIPILFIGDFPSRSEDAAGEFFIGDSGNILRGILTDMEADLDQCRFMHAVQCASGGVPDTKQIGYCRPSVWNEISHSQPNVIVTMGSAALRSVIGKMWTKDFGMLERWVGMQIPWRENHTVICPTYSLHQVMMEQDGGNSALPLIFRGHIEAAMTLAESNPSEKEIYHPLNMAARSSMWEESRVITDKNEALRAIQDIRNKKLPMAFDYETTGLKPFNKEHNIRTISFAYTPSWSTDGAYAYAFDMGESLADTLVMNFMWLLSDTKVRKIAHNLVFENLWTNVVEERKIRGPVWDTMLTAHVLDNRRSGVSLKFLSFVKFGMLPYETTIGPYLRSDDKAKGSNGMNRVWDAPMAPLLKYNALDALLTFMLWETQMMELEYAAFERTPWQ